MSPVKKDNKLTFPSPVDPITIAFPTYKVKKPYYESNRLIIKTTDNKNTFLVENINKIAVKGLSDRKGRVIAKTIARAITKQLVRKQIPESGEHCP